MVVAALKPQDVQKLTVVKLRAELEKRKLDSSGTKPILVARLKEALEERDEEEEEGKGGKDADAKERVKSEEAEQTPATEEEDAKGNELETTTTTFENKEEETTTTTTTNDDEIMDPAPSVETDEDIDPAFDAHDDGANPIVKSNRLTNARKILRRNPYDATGRVLRRGEREAVRGEGCVRRDFAIPSEMRERVDRVRAKRDGEERRRGGFGDFLEVFAGRFGARVVVGVRELRKGDE